MKEHLENLKKVSLPQMLRYTLFALNFISFIFAMVYALAHTATIAANVFAIVLFITFLCNLIYAALTKNGFGFWFILGYGLAMLAVYGFGMLVTLSVFPSSASVLSAIIIFLMPLAAMFLLAFDALGIKGKGMHAPRVYAVVKIILTAVASVALIVFAILTYDAVNNFGHSVHEYTTTRAEFLIVFTVFAILCLLFRITLTEGSGNLKQKFIKSWAFLLLVAGLGGYSVSNYFIQVGSIGKDVATADAAFTRAFGDEALVGTAEMRQVAYSFADNFFGIQTGGYTVVRDIVYTDASSPLTLRYDAYVPNNSAAHKSAIVAMHGRGGDKDIGTNAHRNKYFASQGYVVFDLQVGDFREKDTNVDSSRKPSSEEMLPNIDTFFRYATASDTSGANWDSVFLTGYSMGGSLTAKYGLSYPNATKDCGVTIKGLVPCYPSYWAGDTGIDNYLNYVKADSLPMLMLMGANDGEVDVYAVDSAEEAYRKAGNNHFAGVAVSASGHGCDTNMTSRANQIFLFYMERFLCAMR